MRDTECTELRRDFLVLGISGAIAGIAGCTDSDSVESSSDNGDSEADPSTSPDLDNASFSIEAHESQQVHIEFTGGAEIEAGNLQIEQDDDREVVWAEIGSTDADHDEEIIPGETAVLGPDVSSWGGPVVEDETIRLIYTGTETPETIKRYTPPESDTEDEETADPNEQVTIKDIALPDEDPSTGDEVEVEVEARNSGEDSTDAEFDLKAGERTVDSKTVSIDAQETTSFTLSNTFTSAAEYPVSVNDEAAGILTVLGPVDPQITQADNPDPTGDTVDRRELSDGEYEYYAEIENTGASGVIRLSLFWMEDFDGPSYGSNSEFVRRTVEQFAEGETKEMAVTAGAIPSEKEGYYLAWTPAELEVEVTNRGGDGTAEVQLLIDPDSDEAFVHKRSEVTLSSGETTTGSFTTDPQELDDVAAEVGGRDFRFSYDVEPK